MRIIKNAPQLFSFFICLLLLILRFNQKFCVQSFWAEDGMQFFSRALNYGISYKSTIAPYAGYFHFFPRIISLIALLIPLKFVPIFFNLSCILFTSFVFSLFGSNHYKHIISSNYLRLLVCTLFVFSPGLTDILGNLANIHSIFLFLVPLLYLKNINYKYCLFDYFLISLSTLTEGAVIIFLPLFFFKIIQKRKQSVNAFFEKYALSLIIIVAISCILLNSQNSTSESTHNYLNSIDIYFKTFVNFGLLKPFVTESFLDHHKLEGKIVYLITFIALSLMIRTFFRTKTTFITKQFLLYLLTVPLLFSLITLVRSDIIFFNKKLDYESWWKFRYSFMAVTAYIIPMIYFISLLPNKYIQFIMISFTVIISLSSIPNRFFIPSYDEKYDWNKHYKKVELFIKEKDNKTLKKERSVPIPPGHPWSVWIAPNND